MVRSGGVTDAMAFAAAGAATVTVKVPDDAVVPVVMIAKGFGVHVTPGGSPDAAQVILTLVEPVAPVPGVTVILDVPLPPAVTGDGETSVPAIVKLPVAPLPEKVKLKTDFPPKANGLSSGKPKPIMTDGIFKTS